MSTEKKPEKIDVHAHFLPDFYREQCKATGHAKPDGFPYLPEWNVQEHLKLADEMNIRKSYLSISSPGVHLTAGDDEAARKLCRDCNTAGAAAKKQYPDRFGLWATLPLPDVKGSLEELEFALDTLGADGIAIETNYHGHYIGSPQFEPVWAELNRRKAIVFVHPTTGCALDHGPVVPLAKIPNPVFEFFFDTTRAIINLFYSGAITRYPDIKYIVSHAGACLPPLIERFAVFGQSIPSLQVDQQVSPAFVKQRLRAQFYFDLAGAPFPDQLNMLMPFIDKTQVLYGSDYPFTPAPGVVRLGQAIDHFLPTIFTTEQERYDAYKGNAERLFERKKI